MNIPLSLYIHIPYCIKKCPYCDFNSHAVKGGFDEDLYISCLIEDFRRDLGEDNREIKTVFVGGGTPSLFSPKSYEKLFNELTKIANFAENAEFTLEANPNSSEITKFSDYRKIGFNRISIGVQSFNNELLKKIGRVHNAKEAENALNFAEKAGFERINADLIFALPSQNLDLALKDLKTALTLPITHLSWYQLSIEPNTVFYAQTPPNLPNEDEQAEIYQAGCEFLIKNGWENYEVSAWTKNADYCRHNLNYWNFGDYLGIGAGAAGKITKKNGEIWRTKKLTLPSRYLLGLKNGSFYSQLEEVKKENQLFEFMLNGLRLRQGIKKSLIEQRTSLKIAEIEPKIQELVKNGFLENNQDFYKTTPKGFLFLNELLEKFL